MSTRTLVDGTEQVMSYTLTDDGCAEAVRQYLLAAKDGCTESHSAYAEEFARLEEDCGMQNGDHASCEISHHHTKSGAPEFIRLDAEHFTAEWIDV